MDKQQAAKEISEKVSQAYTLINECENLALEHSIDFEFCVSYGMGGTYYPEKGRYRDAGWYSSTESCN